MLHISCCYILLFFEPRFHIEDISLASENAIRQQHVKSLKQAELSAAGDAYHCKYPDCEGWVIVEQANAGDFICEVCSKKNCLACKVNK